MSPLETGARALIVDDVAMNRRLMRAVLQRDGIAADEASDAGSATRALANRAYDLVLLDIALEAEESGLDVLSAIRGRPELDGVPVILVTGTACDSDSVARGLRAGAQDYVTKPFDPAVLSARVAAACRTRRVLRSAQRDSLSASRLNKELLDEISNASYVQRSTLPSVPFSAPGIHVSGEVIPASGVSGDAFDVVTDARGRVSVVLIDAAGHGSAAGLILTAARSAIHRALSQGESVENAVKAARALLWTQQLTLDACAALGVVRFSADRTEAEVVNASLPAIVSFDTKGGATLHGSSASPIAQTSRGVRAETVAVAPGAVWMLCTDGMTGGSYDDGDVLGLARRLGIERYGLDVARARADGLRRLMTDELSAYGSSARDDASLVVVACPAPERAAAPQ